MNRNDEFVYFADGNTLSFKPFHLTPRHKADQAQLKVMRKKLVQDMIEKSEINLLDKDWPSREAEINKKEAEIQAALEAQRAADAEKEAANAEKENADAEKETADAEKEVSNSEEATEAEIQALLNDTKSDVVLDKEVDVTGNNDESTKEVIHEAGHDCLANDFHVIDEVNETDSDVEYIGNNTEVVNIDDENNDDGNNENDVEKYDKDIKGNPGDIDEDVEDNNDDFDNIDVDFDDVDDDDLEDY